MPFISRSRYWEMTFFTEAKWRFMCFSIIGIIATRSGSLYLLETLFTWDIPIACAPCPAFVRIPILEATLTKLYFERVGTGMNSTAATFSISRSGVKFTPMIADRTVVRSSIIFLTSSFSSLNFSVAMTASISFFSARSPRERISYFPRRSERKRTVSE